MFDRIIANVTSFLKDYALAYIVAALVTTLIFQLMGDGINVEMLIQLGVTAIVAGLLTSVVLGAADGI